MGRGLEQSVLALIFVLIGSSCAIYGNSEFVNETDVYLTRTTGNSPKSDFKSTDNIAMLKSSSIEKVSNSKNDTNTFEEHYVPSYCEVVLIQELTLTMGNTIANDLEGKFGKLKRQRYATMVTSIIPEALYEVLLLRKSDLLETITKALTDEYKLIPKLGEDADLLKKFGEKAKHVTENVLNGICVYSHCCQRNNSASSSFSSVSFSPIFSSNVDYHPPFYYKK